MLFPTVLLLAATAATGRTIEKRDVRVEGERLEVTVAAQSAFTAASPLTPASNTLTLTKRKSAKGYNPRSAAWALYNLPQIGPSSHTTPLISLFEGEEFVTYITFGTFEFEAIVDTGSSDTWVVETGFQCENMTTGAYIPEDECYFGPPYTIESTFQQIPNQNFNITYGDGEYLNGIMGHEQVTIAGLTVRQEVGVVNLAAWEGDNVTSGLTGFAYPAL